MTLAEKLARMRGSGSVLRTGAPAIQPASGQVIRRPSRVSTFSRPAKQPDGVPVSKPGPVIVPPRFF